MNQMPELMSMAMSSASYSAARQKVIATNVANSDTPNYRAKDLAAFSPAQDEMPLRRTHPGHFAGTQRTDNIFEEISGPSKMNGNTVSLEDQIVRGVEAQRQHNRALSVYRSTMDIMRASIRSR